MALNILIVSTRSVASSTVPSGNARWSKRAGCASMLGVGMGVGVRIVVGARDGGRIS
jgi:hypothetical protein